MLLRLVCQAIDTPKSTDRSFLNDVSRIPCLPAHRTVILAVAAQIS